MNILFISLTDPRDTLYGGQQRTYALWQGLKTIGNVWTIVPVAHKRQESRDDAERIYYVCLEKRYSLGWFLQRLWVKFLPRIVVSWGARLPGKNGHCEIEVLKDVKFDMTVARFGLAGRFKPWQIAPMFIDVDDVPVDDYASAHPSHRLRLWLLRLWQNRLCRKARQLWVPDPDEVRILAPYPAAYLPNIPMVDNIRSPESGVDNSPRNVLLFIGYLAHAPNQVALDWFLKTYWNALKERFPTLRYRIAGGGLPDRLKREWSCYKDVELLGFVEDLNEVYASGCAILTPMRIGSGTCLKILESLAYGKLIISTPLGLRGIPQEDRVPENGIYEFVDIDSLFSVISQIMQESVLQVSSNGTEYIKRHYSQDVFNRMLKDCLSRECMSQVEVK